MLKKSSNKIFTLESFKVLNKRDHSKIFIKAFVSKIPSSNIRLIPIRGSKKWSLSLDYRRVRDAISKEISKKKGKLEIKDWAKGTLFLDYQRKGKGFTRDIDNFLKIILDGVFTGLRLDDKKLRILKVFLKESYKETEGRQKIFGVRFSLILIFKKMKELEKELEIYGKLGEVDQ